MTLACHLLHQPAGGLPCVAEDDGLADGDVVPLVPGEHGMESTGLK